MSFESVPVLSEMLVFLFIKKNRVPTIKKHRLGCMACISSGRVYAIVISCYAVEIVLGAETNHFLYLCNIAAIEFLKVFFLVDKRVFERIYFVFLNIDEEPISGIQPHLCNTFSAILELETINEVNGVSTGSENGHLNSFEQTIHVLVESGACHIADSLLSMGTR